MSVNAPRVVARRSRLIAAIVSLATFMALCAVLVPGMESSLVFITILTLSAMAGGLAWLATRYVARKSARIL